ncbi:hypothetical protein FA95DRAFT_1572738 [Auriscalpium vulgare]|uniref:Uncharacterized protein n=1 Tax=Auriscalpium vulgare TaxID=40419 RepID=A0ACB8RSW7_9AGAM|nr:hypothetical protein FA95DRAFT_1572738 [Auriscalpium vulgare]
MRTARPRLDDQRRPRFPSSSDPPPEQLLELPPASAVIVPKLRHRENNFGLVEIDEFFVGMKDEPHQKCTDGRDIAGTVRMLPRAGDVPFIVGSDLHCVSVGGSIARSARHQAQGACSVLSEGKMRYPMLGIMLRGEEAAVPGPSERPRDWATARIALSTENAETAPSALALALGDFAPAGVGRRFTDGRQGAAATELAAELVGRSYGMEVLLQ